MKLTAAGYFARQHLKQVFTLEQAMCGTFITGISWMFLIFFNVAKYKLSPLCTTHLYASICYQLVYYSIDSHVYFLWEKNVFSNAKHFSLFLPCNMAAVQNLYFPTTCVLRIQNQHFQILIQSRNAQVFLSAISISAGMDLAKSFPLFVASNKVVTVRVLHKTHFKTEAKDNWEMAY